MRDGYEQDSMTHNVLRDLYSTYPTIAPPVFDFTSGYSTYNNRLQF